MREFDFEMIALFSAVLVMWVATWVSIAQMFIAYNSRKSWEAYYTRKKQTDEMSVSPDRAVGGLQRKGGQN